MGRYGLRVKVYLLALCLAITSCTTGGEGIISAIEENSKVIGVAIPSAMVGGDASSLNVYLEGSEIAVIGQFEEVDNQFRFITVVPLTRGKTYIVKDKSAVEIGRVTLPAGNAPAPELLAIYPAADTVPENLLKVYLRFSEPMMEGRSASFVHLVKDGRDTMKGTFLDLQPELWNTEGTVLTLWLDPGRIKLDLIPNKELGNPLTKGVDYKLVVGSGWRSKEGAVLTTSMTKDIYVGERDDKSPDVHRWKLDLPKAGTRGPLRIHFLESLDRILAEEAIRIIGSDESMVPGKYSLLELERILEFTPDVNWSPGSYSISAEGRLEDLSGNNLNRPFEVDLTKPASKTKAKEVHVRSFTLK